MIDLGDTYTLKITIKDATGALADASPLTLTLTLPDQTSSGLTPIVHDSTGVYHYGYTTTQAGRHVARWVGTIGGTAQFAHTDVFDVEPAADISIVSLAEIKTQLGETDTSNDDELRGYLLSASENIETTCGICSVRTFTSRVGGQLGTPWSWTPQLRLPNVPVISITSLTPVYNWSPTVTTGEITTRLTNGKITRLDGWQFYGEYDVEYVAGRTVIPSSLRTACKIIVQHLWDTRRGGAAATFAGDETETLPGWGYAIPSRAAQLISGYTVEMLAS